MEISDRRYQELMESIGIRHVGNDSARFAGRVAHAQTPSIAAQIEARRIEHKHADFPKAPTTIVARKTKEILLVDMEADSLRAARNALRFVADVVACSDFRAARTQLLARPPDLLVTNLRLQAYNGLHLVHLMEGTPTRCIVYGRYDDRFLAQEVQAAGAFFEHAMRLPRALAPYVHALLPPRDRRNPNVFDRRGIPRGGRRCTEL